MTIRDFVVIRADARNLSHGAMPKAQTEPLPKIDLVSLFLFCSSETVPHKMYRGLLDPM
jgi:hypothetical protein